MTFVVSSVLAVVLGKTLRTVRRSLLNKADQ